MSRSNFYIVLSVLIVISGGMFFFVRRETPQSPLIGEDSAAPRLVVRSIQQPAHEARGANWERVLNPQLVAGCLDLAIRMDQPSDYIFAACGSFQQSSVYRNVDASGAGG
jgi:hypothetical protein